MKKKSLDPADLSSEKIKNKRQATTKTPSQHLYGMCGRLI